MRTFIDEEWTTHLAWTDAAAGADPDRGAVSLGLAGPVVRDAAPGELLCAALAACVDSTIRRHAARSGAGLQSLAVIASGDVDDRGARGIGHVPAGLQSMRLEIHARFAAGVDPAARAAVLAAAQRRSVVLATLRAALVIDIAIDAE